MCMVTQNNKKKKTEKTTKIKQNTVKGARLDIWTLNRKNLNFFYIFLHIYSKILRYLSVGTSGTCIPFGVFFFWNKRNQITSSLDWLWQRNFKSKMIIIIIFLFVCIIQDFRLSSQSLVENNLVLVFFTIIACAFLKWS